MSDNGAGALHLVNLPAFGFSMHYERAPVLQKEGWVAGTGFGGFAPALPDLALWCLSR
jgi:hypothetical protein